MSQEYCGQHSCSMTDFMTDFIANLTILGEHSAPHWHIPTLVQLCHCNTDLKKRPDRASYCLKSRFMYPAKFDSRIIGRTRSCEIPTESDMDLSVPPLGVQSGKDEN